jgi:hypothetical protein
MNEKKFENFISEYFGYVKSLEQRIANIESKLNIQSKTYPQNPDDYLERKNRFCIFKNEES